MEQKIVPFTIDMFFLLLLLLHACLQDFLRSIPGSLLSCELHEDWMEVLEEEEEEEEQVQDVQR